MARGIAAFIMIASLVMAMTILSGVGWYADVGVTLDEDSHNDDVVAAADNLDGIEINEGRSPSILQGPLAVVLPFVEIFQSFTAVLTNTSGVLQLLFGVPKVAADTVELLFRMAMLITLVFGIRGIKA